MTSTEFAKLSQESQISNLRELGLQALKEFGIQAELIEPLAHFENTTFRVDSSEGAFNLRISRPGTQSEATIRSEIDFLVALRAAGFRVPEPYQGRSVRAESEGVPEARSVVLFRWMGGEFLRNRLTPVEAPLIGRAIAQLHEFVMTWTPPAGFERLQLHSWVFGDASRNLVREPIEGLPEEDRALINQIIYESCQLMPTLPKHPSTHNLIHADLHVGNLLLENGALNIIDFDDSGYAFLIYDFAAALAFHLNEEHYLHIQSAMLAGYQEVRPLPDGTEDLLQPFIRQRLGGVSEWILTRVDNPQLRKNGPTMVHEFCNGLRRLESLCR